ncbi:Transposase (plasmid) [Nostoc flagelliforme CCNUN1]|uniref:Transposase n=1 Tax=Nostoc flagelliforme CCNUN1 TaxID=2038116 RepID=A0A2K8SH17_9NOSO|nr:IS1634 family transposase [Nostoc flagelliforme]AUB34226.1 Transposase [Nostoc flagelliforme CCNUN1]AUB34553.1 Transposase [Nostoc flagelliforme CCNUN1]AUB35024.1 Transposase [Nostoc flagelliforme CCNUN1]AUB35279.1 Transposase [Nostoc flagelliforme CCNUN1]AUB35945.1 Transposase [Nostoc flagelliforme CCNUN1]
MRASPLNIRVQDIDHCGIVAGICDEMNLVEQINRLLGTHSQEIISAGQVVKAMILNGLGFVSAPLYLFEKFFVGKATEHLLGEGIRPEHLNDDRLGRVLDKLYEAGLTEVFVTVAICAARKFGVKMDSLHLDSSSFHVDGDYINNPTAQEAAEPGGIEITYGYSRDHRPDLKQFILDLMCSGDGDIPLYLRVGDGNESDSAMFATIIADFQRQWQIDALFVADAALYTEENLQQMKHLRWVSRVPGTLTAAKMLSENIPEQAFNDSAMPGYEIAAICSEYGGIRQRWLVVESQARKDADLKQLEKRLTKQLSKAQSELRLLLNQEFACSKDALIAAQRLSSKLPLHQLANIQVNEVKKHTGRGRPSKDASPTFYYQVDASLEPKEIAIAIETKRAGRFILATNVLDAEELSNDDILREYKAQQSTERGFRFLKDPLFFTSSVFLNSTERVAALAMVMGLCLLVYSLGQKALRQALERAKKTIDNQLGKPTSTPTLRWVFQCFMSIHLVTIAQIKQIANLTHERQWILQFFGAPCRKYYLLS